MTDKLGDREVHELKPSTNGSSAGQLFVGCISGVTTKESLRKHFSQFGEVTDSVVMYHNETPQGFGFVTYADPEIADKVLEKDHNIDGRQVVVKIPVNKTQRIFVGGFPVSLTEDHQIMLNRATGQSRGFGFVSFDKEEAVEKVLSKGHMHELRGRQVEIKRVESKRDGAEDTSENRIHHGGGGSKSYYGDGGSVEAFGGGYGGNMGSGYGGYGGYEGYGDYCKFAGSYGVSSTGFYPGYSDGFWSGGAMYGAAGYGGSSYGVPAFYGGGSGYGSRGNGSNDGGNGGYGGGGGNGAYAFGNAGAANGRSVPTHYGGGSGYGNSGNGLNDGGNRGYGGSGGNGAYSYGTAGAANGRSVPAYYGRGRGYGNSGSGLNDGGNGGYGGGGGNGAYASGNAGASNGRYHPYWK